MSVVMVMIVIEVVAMVMLVIVVVIMFMQMLVGYAFPVGMRRNMAVVVLIGMFVGMLLHDSVHCIFLNCIHVLHFAASLRKGAYSRVFRTAADVFQVSHFFFHIITHLSLRLSPGLRELHPLTSSRFPSLISLAG